MSLGFLSIFLFVLIKLDTILYRDKIGEGFNNVQDSLSPVFFCSIACDVMRSQRNCLPIALKMTLKNKVHIIFNSSNILKFSDHQMIIFHRKIYMYFFTDVLPIELYRSLDAVENLTNCNLLALGTRKKLTVRWYAYRNLLIE